jgi:hypothetical protein
MSTSIAINVLDTAQLIPETVVDLVERFDMGGVTIVDGTHPDKAFALAKAIQRRRGDRTVIFYRRWREKLPDENMVNQTTSQEFVNYMQDVMEAGFVAAVYNEAMASPMTPITTYSLEVIGKTAPKGWRTVHFKTATGTPRGYNGETPSGYAESDLLWISAQAENKVKIERGEPPVVWIAPHAYFPTWGAIRGHTDRMDAIRERFTALGIDPRFVPMAVGETGLQAMSVTGHISDAGAGFRTLEKISPETYAMIYADVNVKEFRPRGVQHSHLFAVGDQQTANGEPGMWGKFNLLGVTEFWDALEKLKDKGLFDLLQPVVIKPPAPVEVVTPKYDPPELVSGRQYKVALPGLIQMLHKNANHTSESVGTLTPGQVVKYIDKAAVGLDWFFRVEFERLHMTGTDAVQGWVSLQNNLVKFTALPVAPVYRYVLTETDKRELDECVQQVRTALLRMTTLLQTVREEV